jgi:hypothetical protein
MKPLKKVVNKEPIHPLQDQSFHQQMGISDYSRGKNFDELRATSRGHLSATHPSALSI